MLKTKIRTNGKRYFSCLNAYIRIKIWKYRNHTCFCCNKVKRLEKSGVFLSDKCSTHISQKTNRWIFDLNDYVWICRDCMTSLKPKINMEKDDWEKVQGYSYQY